MQTLSLTHNTTGKHFWHTVLIKKAHIVHIVFSSVNVLNIWGSVKKSQHQNKTKQRNNNAAVQNHWWKEAKPTPKVEIIGPDGVF